MASIIVCDKCGESCGNTSKFMHIRAHKMTSTEAYRTQAEKYIDVCLDCYNKIFEKSED